MTWRFGGWRRGRYRIIGRSPGSVSGTCRRWGICSCRRWRCARPRAWCGWAGSPWTGRRCGPTPPRRKAMSYARMSEKEKVLAAEVSALLAEAERIDKAEDARYGKNNRGDELPEELAPARNPAGEDPRGQGRAGGRGRAGGARAGRDAARGPGEDEDTATGKGAAAADTATPKPKAQRNFTDPDSKIMLTGDGAFSPVLQRPGGGRRGPSGDRGHRREHQRRRRGQSDPDDRADQRPTPGRPPTRCSPTPATARPTTSSAPTSSPTEHGTEFYVATGRRRRDEPPPVAPRGRIPKSATAKQRMARTLHHPEAATPSMPAARRSSNRSSVR